MAAEARCREHMICPLPRASEMSALTAAARGAIGAEEGLYDLPRRAVERAMKVQDVIMRAMSGALAWLHAAEILGIDPRSLRRWRARYEADQMLGLTDRRQLPSRAQGAGGRSRARRAALPRALRGLQRAALPPARPARPRGDTVLQFGETASRSRKPGWSTKHRARGRHRRRREPRACFGELLHIDGSTHAWFALAPEVRPTLLAVPDDATNRVLYAQFWEAERPRR